MSLGWKTALVAGLMVALILLKLLGRRRNFKRFREDHLVRKERVSASQKEDQ